MDSDQHRHVQRQPLSLYESRHIKTVEPAACLSFLKTRMPARKYSSLMQLDEETVMPYIYSKADQLEKTAMVGSHQCVALVQKYAGAPATLAWRKGDDVVGNKSIKKGTAIATFVDDKYLNRSTGNHAALYIGAGVGGIYIMDQWKNKEGEKVSARFIKSLGKNKRGRFNRPSNNADAYSIIE